MNQLIINSEYFLQCFGHCSGCFLSDVERQSKSIYQDSVKEGLITLHEKYKNICIEHLVIGFGRGNILNLEKENLDILLLMIHWCKENFQYKKLTIEISTSLIGKLEKQIENACYLLSKSQHIFFNIVINSEITSSVFWHNLQQFYQHTSQYRIEHFGWKEDWGDIIVLNVNPQKLPDIKFLKEFTKDYQSPINISIFPFDKKIEISEEDIKKVNAWSIEMWEALHDKDLNIRNYLDNLKNIDIENSFNDYQEYQDTTEKSYYFIDKNGVITNGSLSIMGEVDKIRLLDKYQLKLDLEQAYITMQKNKVCVVCEYQKECMLSGAYLNLLANSQQIKASKTCLSGYQQLFELASV